MPIDRAPRDTGGGSDLVQARLADAPLEEHRFRSVEDRLAGFRRFLFGTSHPGSNNYIHI